MDLSVPNVIHNGEVRVNSERRRLLRSRVRVAVDCGQLDIGVHFEPQVLRAPGRPDHRAHVGGSRRAMTATTLKQEPARSCAALRAAHELDRRDPGVAGRPRADVRPQEPEVLDGERFLGSLPKACAVARGAMDKGFAGKTLYTLFEIPTPIRWPAC
jgi:hypothetical protein